MFCRNCGKELPDGALFCGGCGTPQALPETPEEELVSGLSALENPVTESAQTDPFDAELAAIHAVLAEPEQWELPASEESEASAPVAPPKKSRKGLIIGLSALITAIVLGIGGWFLYSYLQDSSAYDEACSLRRQGYLTEAMEAFEDLGDFRDAKTQARELSGILEAESWLKWQDYENAIDILIPLEHTDEAQSLLEEAYRMQDYHNAQTHLTEGRYDQARDAFASLGDYLDSKEYAESKVSYLQAQAEAADGEAAQSPAALISAGERFLSLGEYADAPQLASQCYFRAAILYLNEEEPQAAQECTAFMSPEDQKAFTDHFNETYADEDLLKDWASALVLRSELSQKGSFDYSKEYTALEGYLERGFLAAELETAFAGYMDVLKKQQALVNSDGTVSKYVDWLTLELDRVDLVEMLIEKYDLLSNTPRLQSHYLSQHDVVAAYCEIENSIQEQLMGVSASQNPDGSYYIPYKNNTGVGFTLEYTQYFYLNGFLVKQDAYTYTLSAGESVNIPVVFPENTDSWDSWKSSYSYKDLSGL